MAYAHESGPSSSPLPIKLLYD